MKNKFLFPLLTVCLLGAGCTTTTTVAPPPPTNPEPSVYEPNMQTITYLVSTENATKYCNGADMDSAGYRKTITKEVEGIIPATNNVEIMAKEIALLLDTHDVFRQKFSENKFTFNNGTLTVPGLAYGDAWAGVTVVACSVQPLVEVNMLRLPGVTKVVWATP